MAGEARGDEDAPLLTPRPWIALLAGMPLTASPGSIHAFSVLAAPLEQTFGVTRAQASSILTAGNALALPGRQGVSSCHPGGGTAA